MFLKIEKIFKLLDIFYREFLHLPCNTNNKQILQRFLMHYYEQKNN